MYKTKLKVVEDDSNHNESQREKPVQSPATLTMDPNLVPAVFQSTAMSTVLTFVC